MTVGRTKEGELAAQLLAGLQMTVPGARAVHGLRRLSGGASRETWAFELEAAAGRVELVLRRDPAPGRTTGSGPSLPLATEARLIRAAAAAGVPVPRVRHVFDGADGIGGFVMDFVAGETIPRKILRDAEFAEARQRLALQCGTVLARIHAIDADEIPELPRHDGRSQVRQFRAIYDAFDDPRPVFELAFHWLEDNVPEPVPARVVHGDFRNGNLIVGPEGLRAVLDWELAHVGEPAADLAWMCVNSWRFGEVDMPVGGFGRRQEFYAAYEAAAGRSVDVERVHYWEVFGTLKWGVICMMMYAAYASGTDRSVERATIGRRASEAEIDLLALLDPQPRS